SGPELPELGEGLLLRPREVLEGEKDALRLVTELALVDGAQLALGLAEADLDHLLVVRRVIRLGSERRIDAREGLRALLLRALAEPLLDLSLARAVRCPGDHGERELELEAPALVDRQGLLDRAAEEVIELEVVERLVRQDLVEAHAQPLEFNQALVVERLS